jgi:hypothetical protein
LAGRNGVGLYLHGAGFSVPECRISFPLRRGVVFFTGATYSFIKGLQSLGEARRREKARERWKEEREEGVERSRQKMEWERKLKTQDEWVEVQEDLARLEGYRHLMTEAYYDAERSALLAKQKALESAHHEKQPKDRKPST